MHTLVNNLKPSNRSLLIKLAALSIISVLVLTVYFQWSEFVQATVAWQKTLHAMLASHINSVSEDAFKYGGALVALSFGYGLFHAVGPGHGKAVIVTYLGTNKESTWKGIFISFTAAILQSVIAIFLVSALARILKFRFAEVQSYGNNITQVSYVLVIILGLVLILGGVRKLIRAKRSQRLSAQMVHSGSSVVHHNHVHSDHHDGHVNEAHSLDEHSHEEHSHGHAHSHGHSHGHGADCDCSHTHVPEHNESVWQTLMVILSMGVRPCSGAIVVLIYAHLVGVYSYGVVATLMMGLGTGLAVSLIAIATLYARSRLEKYISASNETKGYVAQSFGFYLRMLGGVVLVCLGWSLYSATSVLGTSHPLF